MRVLLIDINDNARVRFAQNLREAGYTVKDESEEGTPENWVTMNQFDVIFIHEGTGNPFALAFVESYCQSYPESVCVLFTGACPDEVHFEEFDVKGMAKTIAHTSRYLVMQNGVSFVADYHNSPDWDALLGLGSIEPSLQILSALLPIGLLWEVNGNKQDAIESLRAIPFTNLSTLETQLQDYVYKRIKLPSDADALQNSILEARGKILAKLGRGDAKAFFDQIDNLCASEDYAGWNDKLATLRDEWITAGL